MQHPNGQMNLMAVHYVDSQSEDTTPSVGAHGGCTQQHSEYVRAMEDNLCSNKIMGSPWILEGCFWFVRIVSLAYRDVKA